MDACINGEENKKMRQRGRRGGREQEMMEKRGKRKEKRVWGSV